MALQHEGVAAANRLKEPDHDLAAGEVVQLGRRRLDPHAVGDLSGKLRVSPPAEQHHLLLAGRRHAAHLELLSFAPLYRCFRSERARFAARAERVSARLRSTHPSELCCRPRAMPRSPGGTSSMMAEPAAV